MTRAMRKRLQRLLDAKGPPVRPQDPQQAVIDQLFAAQHRGTLELLSRLGPDNAPQIALGLNQLMLGASEEAMRIGIAWNSEQMDRVACRSGCSHCCHEPLQVTILDAVGAAAARGAVLDYRLETRDRDRLKRIFAPCPLLHEDRCSIYPARPVICRAYHSLSLSRCQEIVRIQDPGRQVPMNMQLYGLTGIPQIAMQQVFEEIGIDHRPVVLGLAVAALTRDFAELTRDWLGGGRALAECAGISTLK